MEKIKDQEKQTAGGGKLAGSNGSPQEAGWLERHMPAIAGIVMIIAVVIGTLLIAHYTN